MKSAILFWAAGIIALLFGVLAIVEPATVLNIASIVFSVILIFRGLRRVWDAIRFRKNAVKVVVDGAQIDLGIQKKIRLTLLWDGIGALVIGIAALVIAITSISNGGEGIVRGAVYAVAAGFLYTGIANLIESHRLKPYAVLCEIYRSNSFVYILASVVLFAFPFFVGHTVMNIFGIIMIVVGVSLFVWGIRVFTLARNLRKLSKTVAKTVDYKEVK